MRRFYLQLLLAFVCMFGSAQTASAQFWKNWFRKEEKHTYHKKVKPINTEPKKSINPFKKKDIEFPESKVKSRYRVDVFVALYLNSLIKGDKPTFKGRIPEHALVGIDFYEGLKLAADTLNDYGYNIDVYVHDVTDSATSPHKLMAAHELDQSDLIIGALNPHDLGPLANFAKKHQINFVSALSPFDGGVRNNEYFILLQPSLQSHCERIKDIVKDRYRGQKPILLYSTDAKVEAQAYNYLKDEDFHAVQCNALPKKEQLAKLLDSTADNVIIAGIMDNNFAEKLLLHLNDLFPDYKFNIYGMPSWKGMNSLKKPEAYPNIAVYISEPFYFDISTASGQALANMYQNEAKGSKPSEMVFRGYETMYWFAYLLNKYGTIFNEKFRDNGVSPFTRFDIREEKDDEGNFLYFENKHICLYRYQSSSYMVEQ